MKKYNIAIVGATGAVGTEFLKILSERNFPVGKLRLLATSRSAGKRISFKDEEYIVEVTTPQAFENIDLALFAGGAASKEFAHEATKRGAVVIDNSSTFRMNPNVPLVVPEVNPEAIREHKGIIANPNCSTIIMVVALKPLYDYARIKRIVVSTYQAASGAGKEAMEELRLQTEAILSGKEFKVEALPQQIAFNLIPHIDVFLDNAYTKEEMKMVHETRKILGDPEIGITATTVRVPVFRSHSEAINIETEKKISAEKARELLVQAPGVIVIDNPAKKEYPMPYFTSEKDEVFVGRIREDESIANGLNLWVVSDQIRKGAALNAIQIAEYMIANGLL